MLIETATNIVATDNDEMTRRRRLGRGRHFSLLLAAPLPLMLPPPLLLMLFLRAAMGGMPPAWRRDWGLDATTII
jgi:hypothetical protein